MLSTAMLRRTPLVVPASIQRVFYFLILNCLVPFSTWWGAVSIVIFMPNMFYKCITVLYSPALVPNVGHMIITIHFALFLWWEKLSQIVQKVYRSDGDNGPIKFSFSLLYIQTRTPGSFHPVAVDTIEEVRHRSSFSLTNVFYLFLFGIIFSNASDRTFITCVLVYFLIVHSIITSV